MNLTIRIHIALLMILLFFQHNLFATPKKTSNPYDSLFTEIKRMPDTESKVDSLIQLFRKSSRGQLNYKIVDEAIKIAGLIHYTEGEGRAYYRKGLYARYNYDYYKCVKNQLKALPLLKKTADTIAIIKCLNSLGIVYRKLNVTNTSFEYYFDGYKLAKKINYPSSMAVALNGIGNLFIDTKKYDIALYYFREALALETASNNIVGVEYDCANIGEAYLLLKSYDSAHYYLDKAYNLSLNNGKKGSEVYTMILFAKMYQQQGQYKKSNIEYEKSLAILKNKKSKRYIANALVNIGRNDIMLGKTQEGIRSVEEGLDIALKIGSKENVMEGYSVLSGFYRRKGQYKKALNAHIKATNFKDSILNEKAQKELLSTHVALESFEKDDKIKHLKEENIQKEQLSKRNFRRLIYGTLAAIFIVIILFALFLLYRKNTRLEIENLNGRLQSYVLQKSNESKKKRPIKEQIASFDLSAREVEVLELIVSGATNEEIAKQLFISKNTVKYHSKNIYVKLDVQNRIQVIKKLS